MDAGLRDVFERKEAKLRSKQAAELSALLKRIDGRRKEHIKQRNLDSKRCHLPAVLALGANSVLMLLWFHMPGVEGRKEGRWKCISGQGRTPVGNDTADGPGVGWSSGSVTDICCFTPSPVARFTFARLLQRNRNVQSVLESKQSVETQRRVQDIRNELSFSTSSRPKRSSHSSVTNQDSMPSTFVTQQQ